MATNNYQVSWGIDTAGIPCPRNGQSPLMSKKDALQLANHLWFTLQGKDAGNWFAQVNKSNPRRECVSADRTAWVCLSYVPAQLGQPMLRRG